MRIMFAGTSSNVGKTTVVMGIMRALSQRKLKVQGYKAGPDYIDPAFHTFATGLQSRNLDTWMLDETTIQGLLAKQEEKCDVAVMEGVMGMYDGADVRSIEGSSAHLAKITKTPVILIIDGSGVAASAAAMTLGFKIFDESVHVAGVVVNKVSGEYHYNLIKEAIEYHVGIPCIGYLKKNKNIELKSRHLGLIPSVEVDELDQTLNDVADMVNETVDLDLLLDIAKQAPRFDVIKPPTPLGSIRLGVAYDKGFNFYYEDNLDLLEAYGCELVKFSPIEDKKLPNDLDGLYIGGGFPEVFAKELADNYSMKKSIKSAIENGLPTYAECGGLMYLCDSIKTLEDQSHNMVGVFPYPSEMTEKLQRFGYVEVSLKEDSILGPKGLHFKGHEFHRSQVVETSGDKLYDITKVRKGINWTCGYKIHKCVGGYPHVHFYNNLEFAEGFIKTCLTYKESK